MTNQIMEVLEQRPLDMPQCKAPQMPPSHLLAMTPMSEAASPLTLQHDVPLDSNGTPASGLLRPTAVVSPLDHTSAPANGGTSWQGS